MCDAVPYKIFLKKIESYGECMVLHQRNVSGIPQGSVFKPQLHLNNFPECHIMSTDVAICKRHKTDGKSEITKR